MKREHSLCDFGRGQGEGVQVHLGQPQAGEGEEGPDQGAQEGQDQLEGQFGDGTPGEEHKTQRAPSL